jgi:AraC family transcriptional regulator
MKPTPDELAILHRHVGTFTPPMVKTLLRNIEFVLTPELSLFVPALGPCDYAVTRGHVHPAWSFVYVLSLSGRFELEGRRIVPPVKDRPWIWALAPGVEHGEERFEGHNSYIAFMIDTALFARVLAEYGKPPEDLPRHQSLPADEALYGFLAAFFREGRQRRPGRDDCLRSLATLVAHRMARLLTGAENETAHCDSLEIHRLAGWLKGHLEERLTAAQLAARLHMSESSLLRYFKRETGQTPMEFVAQLRLEQARARLGASGATLTEIARQCGFASSSHFSSAFSAAYGLAPREYRRRLGGG